MFRSIIRTTAALAAAAAFAGAPVATAHVATDGPQLNYAQLRAIHGHVPPEPLGVATYNDQQVRTAPVQASSPGSSTSPVPWIAGGVALLLFAGLGFARFTGVRPLRRRQPAA
jgi:hypothetical protein